ncbi:MAG TPA: MBOAT family protein [Casimicrobiaceae bacterium]|nr:MBOAT family protein [Casimicrobiaceae bacterium]
MIFASPLFLFLFLPLTIVAYWTFPGRVRKAVLLAASLLFYAWGEARYVPLILGSICLNWWIGIRIADASRADARKRWAILGVAANLAVLALFKYANFAVANLNALAPILSVAPVSVATIPLPLGISFFTFHAISYVVDVYKRTASAQRGIGEFALYILLFPQLIAGPIIRYRDIAAQLVAPKPSVAEFAYGVRRFILGLGKKLLIANTLGRTADDIFGLPASELGAPLAWLGLLCYTLQIYFDFSGYSDMAIGLMRMFGFRILENFDYPYVASSVREFWRRWHISLSNWFRDYLYVPLGGNRLGTTRSYANLVIVFVLCGLWHGASWTFVLWGTWHGLFLVVERGAFARVLERRRLVAHVYTLAVVAGAWVLFRCDTVTHAIDYYAALAGLSDADPMLHPLARYADGLLMTTLLVAVVFAMPIGRRVSYWLDDAMERSRKAIVAMTAEGAWLVLVFVASAATLAAGTYNPFIYFRF